MVFLLPPSSLDKFLPLLPASRKGLERRRRKEAERELIKDTDEMMEIILPLCLSRPNVYFHLSETLSKWILTVEQIDDESDLETILSSIQPFSEEDDNSSLGNMSSSNSVASQRRRHSSFIFDDYPQMKQQSRPSYSTGSFGITNPHEEKDSLELYPSIRQQRTRQQRSNDNADTWALLRQSQRRLTSTRASLAEDLKIFAEMYGSDFDDSDDEQENNHSNFTIEEEDEEESSEEFEYNSSEEEEEEDDDDNDEEESNNDKDFPCLSLAQEHDYQERLPNLRASRNDIFSSSQITNYFHEEEAEQTQRLHRNVERKNQRRERQERNTREEDQELYNLLAQTKKRLSIVPIQNNINKNEDEVAAATTTSKLCDFYDNEYDDTLNNDTTVTTDECSSRRRSSGGSSSYRSAGDEKEESSSRKVTVEKAESSSSIKNEDEKEENENTKEEEFNFVSSFFSNLPFVSKEFKVNEEKKGDMRRKKNDVLSKSGRFLSQDQMEHLASTTTNTSTIEEIQLDINFLRNEIYNAAMEQCSRRRIRETISALIQQFESDIRIYNSIRRNKDQKFQKEWNNEKDLFLYLLDYLEARIVYIKQQQQKENCKDASFYKHITASSTSFSNDEEQYPYALVYNQILNQYLAHTRTSSREDEQSDHYRWKRPERATSESRWKDFEMVEELISCISLLEVQKQEQNDSPNFDAASERVMAVLESIRDKCMKEAQRLTKIEVKEQQRIKKEQEKRRAMKRFKKRNNRTRMSFAALSREAKLRLLGGSQLNLMAQEQV